jgi:hypothetical protein
MPDDQYDVFESIIANKVASSGLIDSLSVKLKLLFSKRRIYFVLFNYGVQ